MHFEKYPDASVKYEASLVREIINAIFFLFFSGIKCYQEIRTAPAGPLGYLYLGKGVM